MFNARQPTIFLIDNEDFVWLWQGWWPQEDPEGMRSYLEFLAFGLILKFLLGSGDIDQSTDNRSGEIRWQAERRAAMETTVLYCKEKQKANSFSKQTSTESSSSSVMDDNSPLDGSTSLDVVDDSLNADAVKGNIVWAGLEPIEFIALFPDWIERKDVGQINIQVCVGSTSSIGSLV